MPTRYKLQRSLLNVVLMAGVLLFGAGMASAIRIVGPDKPIADTYFGMHLHRADSTTAWPIARFGAWRYWDAAVSWERLEPRPGQWDFRRLDTLVALAESHGIEPLLTLGITPRWAASRPDEPFVYGAGGNSPPRDLRHWENYVRTVAERYRGRIRYYELWNEPTFDEIDQSRGFYAGSAAAMVELGRIAYRVLKSVDPENKLISPGFTDEGRRLDLYLRLGGKEITDVVAHHFYAEKPEHLPRRVEYIRKVMAEHGLGHLPLWNTESGYWLEAPGEKNSPNWPSNEEELGGYMARLLVLGAAAGIERFYWYSWEKTMFNRLPRDTQSNSAIRAYMQTMRWLRGARVDHCASPDRNLWVCELVRGTQRTHMVWAARDALSWSPPDSWQITQLETLDARAMPYATGEKLSLGAAPVLLKTGPALQMGQRDGNGSR